jgi:protein-disulfide isomerase
MEEGKVENKSFEVKDNEEGKKVNQKNFIKENLTNKIRGNPWIASTIVLGIILTVFLLNGFMGITGGSIMTGSIVSENDAMENLDSFLKIRAPGAEVLNTESFNDYLFNVNILIEGQEIPVQVTKDGKYIVQLTPLETGTSVNPVDVNVPKSDKPIIELFVMTHCPYGTQAEKGLIPAIKALENVADIKIRFVDYFMHDPEEEETPKQVCIREEQSEKWLPYLECFLEDGDSERCIAKLGISKIKINSCINNKKSDEYYASDSELSKKYGVKGSPTLIINGVQVSSARDSQSYLNAICSAFNNEPEECDKELSSATPSPMWGWDETGSSTTAQC